MRILFVNSIQMWGGGEVWLMDMMRGLAARGHAPEILCRRGTPLEARAREAGWTVHAIRFGGDLDPGPIAQAAALMRRRRYDVVCTNTDKDLRAGGMAARLAGVRAIVPSREVDYPLKDTWRYRFAYNCLATAIAANSEATKRTLLRSAPWLRAERVQVIYKGIDVAPFVEGGGPALRRELGIPFDALLVGFAGTIDDRKGVPALLEAFAAVQAAVPSAHLVLAGEGRLRDWAESSARERGLTVHFAGFRRDIPAFMDALDVFVLPSQWEGFGYVVVEAMAARRAVVVSRASSLPEIVVEGETGLLAPVGDAAAFATAITSLLRDPALRQRMGRAGRARVESHFTFDRMIDGFESLFAGQTNPPAPPHGPTS